MTEKKKRFKAKEGTRPSFIGRDSLLEGLKRSIEGDTQHFLITGRAGVGKTTFIRYFFEKYKDILPDNSEFIQARQWKKFVEHLSSEEDKNPLFIIDGLDELPKNELSNFREWLYSYKNLKSIIASREIINIFDDQQQINVGPLTKLQAIRLLNEMGADAQKELFDSIQGVTKGHPLMIKSVGELVTRKGFSWSDITEYLRSFKEQGVKDPSGEPVSPKSNESTTSGIAGGLRRAPKRGQCDGSALQ